MQPVLIKPFFPIRQFDRFCGSANKVEGRASAVRGRTKNEHFYCNYPGPCSGTLRISSDFKQRSSPAASKIFGISDGGLFFTVMLHLGTLAAVLVVYRKRIIEMLLHPVKQAKYWIWMIVATLVTAVMALVFKDVIDAANEGSLLGFCFLFTAALLVLCDFIRQKVECKLTVPSMKWYHAVFIGFVQGVAILPGISRSGSTITGATLCSMKKEDAAEFSFLLSIPAILGGAVLEIPGAVSAGAANINWLSVVLGVAAAAVSGYFAVRFMIKLITKHSLWGFAIYTAILGAFIVLDQNILHLIAW